MTGSWVAPPQALHKPATCHQTVVGAGDLGQDRRPPRGRRGVHGHLPGDRAQPSVREQVLTSIVDSLPAGFTYVPGSTTGTTTSDPADGDDGGLAWSGRFVVPAGTASRLAKETLPAAGTEAGHEMAIPLSIAVSHSQVFGSSPCRSRTDRSGTRG